MLLKVLIKLPYESKSAYRHSAKASWTGVTAIRLFSYTDMNPNIAHHSMVTIPLPVIVIAFQEPKPPHYFWRSSLRARKFRYVKGSYHVTSRNCWACWTMQMLFEIGIVPIPSVCQIISPPEISSTSVKNKCFHVMDFEANISLI